MKLYRLYIKFTFQNALRFPRQATKLIPTLTLLLIGLIWSIGIVVTTVPDRQDAFKQTMAMFNPNIVYIMMLGMVLYSAFGKTGIINARASDANFLMPAPITPFQLHNFMELKNMLSIAGMLLFFTAIYGRTSMDALASNWLIYPLFFSMLLSLYIFSFVNYITRTAQDYLGRYLKWILLVLILGYFALVWQTTGGLLFNAVLQPSVLMKYYPIIGWNMTLMRSIMTLNITDMLISFTLLTATLVGMYYWAKSQKYEYYEEELTYIQKTEERYKRAYSGHGIELKTKFVQSNKGITQTGEKVLMDIAWLRAGKRWWMKWSLLFKAVFLFVVSSILASFFLMEFSNVDDNGIKGWLLAYGAVLTYMRFFGTNKKVSSITEDTYVNLMPFKPIYKLLYPQVVNFRLAILSTIVIMGTLIVALGARIGFNPSFFMYAFIMTLLFELFDLVRIYILQPLTINLFLGSFFRQIVELVLVVGLTYVAALPLIYMDGLSGIYLSIIILVLYIVGSLWISLVIYERIEKGKKSDSAF